ncbi:MAG TPA: hypothetical protein VFQ05_18075 [Candidatus Eisenbacteria bacterium]|nr:hypothetical protein [Candidatus Eisenbacteria bacterium]
MDVDALLGRESAEATPDFACRKEPAGEFTMLDGEPYYRIAGVDRVPTFLMTLASDSDLWMFITSRGGLTCGRRDPDGSLFPYESADRLNDGHLHTGPITVMEVQRGDDSPVFWEPLARWNESGEAERNLYKNVVGNRLVFEEVHRSLGLVFSYRWSGSDELGLVRTATLENRGARRVSVHLLDGFRNVLPYGAPLTLHQHSSSLIDAYKRTDLDPATGLGTYSLTSRVVDRPEAAECLRANIVWCQGLHPLEVSLGIDAVEAFRRGEPVSTDRTSTGRRGNYFAVSTIQLAPGARTSWHLVADVGRSHVEIQALRARLLDHSHGEVEIERSLVQASENLTRIVASADGIQLTGRREAATNHFANVLFNTMRGGVFTGNSEIPAADLKRFLDSWNRNVSARHDTLLRSLPGELTVGDLLTVAAQSGDADLERLAYEYLPLYFGRRHGDPSRPWNRFSIHVRNPDGSRALRYEGNWRDIFQNWEALAHSFPEFLPGFIAKFVNASTVDGFNPYRISRDGVDWEVADPHDPWSHIGYWGDHQIIYLLKLLEALTRYAPDALERLLEREIFSYADVPYRLKSYREILADPRSTVEYDAGQAARVAARERDVGIDGRLVPGPDGAVYHVSLLEKLLVPLLAKLSNFVADGGIWMNTQRPEWNDANNALAGYGVSVVTLCYLRRHLEFLERLIGSRGAATARVSLEVVAWLGVVRSILDVHRPPCDGGIEADRDRKRMLDALGAAFADYRSQVYSHGFSGKREVVFSEVAGFLRLALEHVDHAVRANRRDDDLYHAYRILELGPDQEEARSRPLSEMLEGQVAALSSGLMNAAEAVELLVRLFESRLFRDDQRSFLLYPERELPSFLERNKVLRERAIAVPLLRELLKTGERSLLEEDAFGVCHFHPDFRNARDLESAMDRLSGQERWSAFVRADRKAVRDLFEEVFHHHSFTGRSGAMYGYEGLGCIYWHMVAKLLLAVQEHLLRAIRDREQPAVVEALGRAYFRIRGGLGFEKTVLEYGAFPTDPYSHTPRHAGAQQPGMTGMVKEMILTRFGELGVQVADGAVAFRPVLLRRDEFLFEHSILRSYDVAGNPVTVDLPAGALAFSVCQVPVVYRLTGTELWIQVTRRDGATTTRDGDRLDAPLSRALFRREGDLARIDVGVPEGVLWSG